MGRHPLFSVFCPSVLLLALVLATSASGAEADPKEAPASLDEVRPVGTLPGIQLDGQILLPTQWSLKPAGKQVKLGDFPVNIAVHPEGDWAAILHAGYGEHEVIVTDLADGKVVSRVTIPQAFYGICFDPAGERLYVSGAEDEVVHRFRFAKGYLSDHEVWPIAAPKEKFVPAGLHCSSNGKELYVAQAWGDRVSIVSTENGEALRQISFEAGSYPYAPLTDRAGKRLFVSLWGKSSVAAVDPATGEIKQTWKTDSHPTEMVLSPKEEVLYVACANSNTVHVIEVGTGTTLEVIRSALYPQALNGSTPNSLCLTAAGNVLIVANADNNNVAMVDVSEPGHSRPLGYVPVGWYPTSVRVAKDDRILVANGKGLMSTANRQGPNPLKDPPATVREYIGGLFRGTLSLINPPSPDEMARYTRQAFACSPLQAESAVRAPARSPNNPIPAKVGEASPIKHCIYIIKENRTYDQIFGDIPQGNGDPTLCIFPEQVTPNHHALVRNFVLLDNFYVESEVSADGHEWSMAAYATDFVEKTWPLNYRGGKGKLTYPSEGSLPIAFPAGGYIWDRCAEAEVSYRSYGEFIANGKTPADPGKAKVKALEGHFDPLFRSYDLDYLDVDRAARFIHELKGYEETGDLPRFIVLRLPNDHTFGSRVGKRTPTAMVADNDLALGQLVEAVSQSKFWKETAIFVVEDDAQNGSDHVDAHRTVALVISPYTKRKFVDSNMYSTSSMLRTMELILGLPPMSQFDAAALPMYASFQAKPDLTPYEHRKANVDLETRNLASAWGADLSETLDLSAEDRADDLLLNEIVWKSVRGADSEMPPPVRAAFVFTLPEEEDEEDDD